jgi:hypothetical protein
MQLLSKMGFTSVAKLIVREAGGGSWAICSGVKAANPNVGTNANSAEISVTQKRGIRILILSRGRAK